MKNLNLPEKVDLSELVAREGPQHHEKFVSTEAKVWLVHAAIACGFKRLEATSFANPGRLPQFRDAHEVMRRLDSRIPRVYYCRQGNEGRDASWRVDMGNPRLPLEIGDTHSCSQRNALLIAISSQTGINSLSPEK